MATTLAELQELYRGYALGARFEKDPVELYEPANYILSLGGKQIRPCLTLLGFRLYSDQLQEALPVAHAMELFHNFTLMHDDIMDCAPTRRGQPTVYVKYGTNSAILSGDVMLVEAYHFLSRCPEDKLPILLHLFNRTAREVCEGQQMDMNFEQRSFVSPDEYVRMIELKTAVLLGCCLEAGAILGGASTPDAMLLYETGRLLGISFQLLDDYLDTFGDAATFGKQIGGDILQNKKTYLLIRALELGDAQLQQQLQSLLAQQPVSEAEKEQKIKEVTAIYLQTQADQATKAAINDYYDAAMAALQRVALPEARKQELYALSKFLLNRQH